MTAQFEVKVLVFAASLRTNSLNDRLATLATRSVESFGGAVDRASMSDFDCPSYDGDEESAGHMPEGATALVSLGERARGLAELYGWLGRPASGLPPRLSAVSEQ